MIANLWRLINRPLPGWLTIMLVTGAIASAAAVLPYFSSGTASFGPGGAIDLGTADANAGLAVTDPGLFNQGGTNVGIEAPNSSTIKLINCITSGCTGGNQQTSVSINGTAVNATIPVQSTSAGATAFGPDAPCYSVTGTACSTAFHYVSGPLAGTTVVVATSNCLTLTWCTLNGASSITLTGNAVFATGEACYGSISSTSSVIVTMLPFSGSVIDIELWNGSSGTYDIGTNFLVYWGCFGT